MHWYQHNGPPTNCYQFTKDAGKIGPYSGVVYLVGTLAAIEKDSMGAPQRR
jgi:hypothetical protein